MITLWTRHHSMLYGWGWLNICLFYELRRRREGEQTRMWSVPNCKWPNFLQTTQSLKRIWTEYSGLRFLFFVIVVIQVVIRCICVLKKVPVTFIMSVHVSLYISMAPTGWILMQLGIGDFYEHLCENPNFVKSLAKILATLHEDVSTFCCYWCHYIDIKALTSDEMVWDY